MRSELPKPWLVSQQEQPGRYLGSEQINKPSPGKRNSAGIRLLANLFLTLSSTTAPGTPSVHTFHLPDSGSPLPSACRANPLRGSPEFLSPSSWSWCSGRTYLVHDGGRWGLDAWLLIREGQLFQQVHVGQGIFQGDVGGHGCRFCCPRWGDAGEGNREFQGPPNISPRPPVTRLLPGHPGR